MPFEDNYEEDLVPRIRDLIDGYSKNSILKEYLQNADDSGATELTVTFDKRTFSSLEGSVFQASMGPSLVISNNATFAEKDFRAIVKISAQGKVEDPNSTGRFGQGFSSSFSVSDHPSFVSNGRAYWFDVLKIAVAKGQEKSIQGWYLKEDKEEIDSWLQTFSFNETLVGTTFRLPLRTESTANIGNISHEIFKFDDFLKWCREWKAGSSGMLFLRHVQKLTLQEIDENGDQIVHCCISTDNVSEIKTISDTIQREFNSGLIEICNEWKTSERTLPMFKYNHEFQVRSYDRLSKKFREKKEKWAVVNGIFRGENDCLIDQAIKVLTISPNPRKVLPWAGVAVQINENNVVKKVDSSQLFTFLPLPMTSKYPVHIHGWFDLNPKRTEITNDGDGHDKEILVHWNNLLFEEAIGKAWAYLIDFVKESCPSTTYYALWPKTSRDDFDEPIIKGFYQKMLNLKCLNVKGKDSQFWASPQADIYHLPRCSQELKIALNEHFSTLSPAPPMHVLEEFEKINNEITTITPGFVRNYLTEQAAKLALPVSFDNLSIDMLSKLEWFKEVFVYCAEANETNDYKLVEGLPLELNLAGKVDYISSKRIVTTKPRLSIFKDNKELFVCKDLAEILSNAAVLPDCWLPHSLENYLIVLSSLIESYDKSDKLWLESVIDLVCSSGEDEIYLSNDKIKELKIVAETSGEFLSLGADNDAPFHYKSNEIVNIPIMKAAGMKVIAPEYLDLYKPLVQLKRHDFIKELKSNTLAQHLLYLPEEDYCFFEAVEVRDYIINILVQDLSWFADLSKKEKGYLYNMPFLVTDNGNIISKNSSKQLYLPAGFNAPEHISNLNGKFEIIDVETDKHRELYLKMGFVEQTAKNYMSKVILPFIASNPAADDVINISKWLANNWDELVQDLTEAEVNDVLDSLSSTQFVIDNGNTLNYAYNYYHPDFYSSLPKGLQDSDFKPHTFEDKLTQDNWIRLLDKLGISKIIIPQHIVSMVTSISQSSDVVKSIELLNYISNHFECFEEMKFNNRPLFSCMSELDWIAVEQREDKVLSPEKVFRPLDKPKNLILSSDFKKAGGVFYRISSKIKLGKKDEHGDFSEFKIAKKIGILTSLPIDAVFNSFNRLRYLNASGDRIHENVIDYAKEFYRYLGRNAQVHPTLIPETVTEQSLIIKGNWLSSQKVFQQPIKLTGIFSWGELLENEASDSNLAEGLKKLGVMEKPSFDYLINFMRDLPRGKKLDPQQLKDAKAILAELQDNFDNINTNDFPILSRTDKLFSAEQLYIKDIESYEASLNKNENLEFCQQQFKTLAEHIGVLSLAEYMTAELDPEKSIHADEENTELDKAIRASYFKTAILRLMHHEAKLSSDDTAHADIEHLLPKKLNLMDSLTINYSINDTWIYDDLTAVTFKDAQNKTLYILNQDDNEDICESIASFISDAADLGRDCFSIISRILRNELFSLEETKSLLDQKNIKSLPEEIVFEEDISLYEEPELAAEEVSGNDVEAEQSHYSHKDKENGELSKQPVFEVGNAESSIEDIPPPTTPKSDIDTSSSILGNQTRGSSGSGGKLSGTLSLNRGDMTEDKGRGSQGISLGQKSSMDIISPNDRKPVYVGKGKEATTDSHDKQEAFATEIGNRGEEYILENAKTYKLSPQNNMRKAPTNNKGFDIEEIDESGSTIRYIEVKTLSGPWGVGGVALTSSQLEFAQVNDNWVLFIVENINTVHPSVYVLDNPVQSANRYMFDSSWKQLSKDLSAKVENTPSTGDNYKLPDGIYEISEVISKGIFQKVKLKHIETKVESTRKFDQLWEKC
jgi:hypothetical protein